MKRRSHPAAAAGSTSAFTISSAPAAAKIGFGMSSPIANEQRQVQTIYEPEPPRRRGRGRRTPQPPPRPEREQRDPGRELRPGDGRSTPMWLGHGEVPECGRADRVDDDHRGRGAEQERDRLRQAARPAEEQDHPDDAPRRRGDADAVHEELGQEAVQRSGGAVMERCVKPEPAFPQRRQERDGRGSRAGTDGPEEHPAPPARRHHPHRAKPAGRLPDQATAPSASSVRWSASSRPAVRLSAGV